MNTNPYWSLLHSSLRNLGVRFETIADYPLGRWLVSRRRDVDVIHFHFFPPLYAYNTEVARFDWVLRLIRNLILARVLGYRTVYTLHDLDPTWTLRPKWVDHLGHWAGIKLTSAVMVHGESSRHRLAARFGRVRGVTVVQMPSYIGIYENTTTRSEARSQLGLTDCEKVFVFFGGIRPNKGIDSLISSFRRLRGRDLRLLIAGPVWPPQGYLDYLLQIADGDERIRVDAKFVPDERIQLYLNAATAVVLPFRWVLSSSSAMLAMSFRRAVIAPEIGSLPDMIDAESGLLYKASDTDALYDALVRSCAMDMDALGERAFQRAAQFTFVDLARRTIDVYRDR